MIASTAPAAPRTAPARAPEPRITVRRGFGWSASGYLAYMLCQWGMLTILARAGSSDLREVALFSMALAIVTPVFLFSGLGLRRALATDAARSFRLPDYLRLRIGSSVAALALIAGLLAALGVNRNLAWATLALGVAKLFETTSDIFAGYFQSRERIDVSSRATIARGVLSLAGFAAAFAITGQVAWAIAGMAAGGAVVLFAYECPRVRRFAAVPENSPLRHEDTKQIFSPLSLEDTKQTFSPPRHEGTKKNLFPILQESPLGVFGGLVVKKSSPSDPSLGGLGGLVVKKSSLPGWVRLAILTVPLGIVALVTSLKASIPVFIVEAHLGATALGLFTAVFYFHHGINRVVSSLGEAAAARLASLHVSADSRESTRLLGRLLAASLAISLASVAVAAVAGGFLLRLAFGPAYAGLGGLLVAMFLAASIANLQTVFDYALTALRRFRVQPYLYGGGAALLLLLCLALVPSHGLVGAVWSLGIASFAELVAAGAIVAMGGRREGARA